MEYDKVQTTQYIRALKNVDSERVITASTLNTIGSLMQDLVNVVEEQEETNSNLELEVSTLTTELHLVHLALDDAMEEIAGKDLEHLASMTLREKANGNP